MTTPYYCKGIGTRCHDPKCKKSRYQGDDIGFIVYGATFCKEHAQQECLKYGVDFPDSDLLLTKNQKEVFEFLKQHLRLEIRFSGGCPAENAPDDRDIYLILAGQAISQVRLD